MKDINHGSRTGEQLRRYSDLILSRCRSRSGLRTLVLFILCIQFTGCATAHVLSETDKRALIAGEKTIVLLRVECEIDDLACQPFGTSGWIGEPYVALGLGSFETIGEPRRVPHYFFSDESRHLGWTYYVLSPGIYYLAVVGPRSDAQYQDLRVAPRWRIDVPEISGLIYAGTLHLSGRTDGIFLLGGKVVKPSDNNEFIIKDEIDNAKHLLARHFTQTMDERTILMQRWKSGEPIIIRSPRIDSNK